MLGLAIEHVRIGIIPGSKQLKMIINEMIMATFTRAVHAAY